MNKALLKEKLLPDSLNKEITDKLSLITYNANNVTFSGSFVRRSIRDASDIDLSEEFANVKQLVTGFKSIVKKLVKSKTLILDIKCGCDPVVSDLFKYLGTIKHSSVIDYDKKQTSDDLKKLYLMKYVSKEEYDEYEKLCNQAQHSVSSYLDLRDSIRNLMTLRWSPAEITAGKKHLRSGVITLETACTSFINKVDIVFVFQGFYTEMSNILMLLRNPNHHVLEFMPLTTNINRFTTALKFNLFEYLHHKDKNVLKAMKRTFSLALLFDDTKLVNKLLPLLMSNVAILNRCNGVLKTIQDVLEKTQSKPYETILTMLDNLKPVLANIFQFNFGEKYIDGLIDSMNKSNLSHKLDQLIDRFDAVINRQTLKFIHENKINLTQKYLI
jgi:predicted nucleotidyltransferase